jgi:hypothetical protein
MGLLLRKTFSERIKGFKKGPSGDFFLSLIGEVLNEPDEVDYYLVVYLMLSKLDKKNGQFLCKYIRKCLRLGYDKSLFFNVVWLAYIGDRQTLLLMFSDTKKYDFFFRYYIGLMLDITKMILK